MLELAKSVARFPWALSLFGAQQMASLLSPRSSGPEARVESDLYSVGEAAQLQFGDLAFAAFQVGDELQQDAIGFAFDVFTLKVFSPQYVQRVTCAASTQSADTLRTFSPGPDLSLAWQQLQNNYEVYNLVKQVAALLHESPSSPFDLPLLIRRAYALGQYPDLWAIEGLGHDYAQTFWGKGPFQNILAPSRTQGVPTDAMTMLHAGIGLLFGQKLLPELTPYDPCQIQRMLGTFIGLVCDNARPGYEGAAYESLGLVARTWHAPLVLPIDQALREMNPDVATYFWHGVGRALYFLPIHFVPGLYSPWLAADSEPPDETARRNTIAGLAWATALVNIRQPQILASLVKYHGDRLGADDAFTNGVMSVMIMASDITCDDVYIESFLAYQPDASDLRLAELWNRLVKAPAERAVRVCHPILLQRGRLGEVFHYTDLARLAG